MVKIAIVEDDLTCAESLKELLNRYRQDKKVVFSVTHFQGGYEFLEKYEAQTFDLVFLDIMLPHFNGLEIAKSLRKIDETVQIIFVTYVEKYAIDGYRVSALDFIVKPVDYTSLHFALDRFMRIYSTKKIFTLNIKDENGIHVVPTSEIVYIESFGHYLKYHTVKTVYTVRGSIAQVEEDLKDEPFFRCQKSYLVNLLYVKKTKGLSLFIGEQEIEIPISRVTRNAFLQALASYFGDGLK